MQVLRHTTKVIKGTKASPYRAVCECGWRARPTVIEKLSLQTAQNHTNHYKRIARAKEAN